MRAVELKLFKFDELSDRAKERARDWYRQDAPPDDWWDFVYSDAEQCAKLIGITLDRKAGRMAPTIWFSGFSSQGDGACFEGEYRYAKGAAKAIRAHAPQDSELHRIADELQALQRRAFYSLGARMSHSGHYYHSGCMSVNAWRSDDSDISADTEESLRDIMRSFADWIYRQLEREHDYQVSDECVDEAIRANEYEFTEEGALA